MNAAVIDTNVLIDCFQRGGGAADAISDYDRILVCPAVIGEFKAGIDTGTKRGKKAKERLDEFLDDPAVEIVPCTDETAEYYARIYRILKEMERLCLPTTSGLRLRLLSMVQLSFPAMAIFHAFRC